MNINEEDINDDFFEEYGEEMTQAFLSFCNHFREYVCEMDEKLCRKCLEEAHKLADEYHIQVREENGDFFYKPTIDDELKFTYGVLQLQLEFTEFVKKENKELWEKAVQYAADYGGVGRVQFFHVKDKDEENGNNDKKD